ncbi:MAG TPA: hypothetical protein QF753_02670 [Victivallales bacterium]|nr:hypothetical protein [Victivallales bacterium]
MKRRKFLKIIFSGIIFIYFSKFITYAQKLPISVLNAVKNGKYPGKIRLINGNEIMKKGKWLG